MHVFHVLCLLLSIVRALVLHDLVPGDEPKGNNVILFVYPAPHATRLTKVAAEEVVVHLLARRHDHVERSTTGGSTSSSDANEQEASPESDWDLTKIPELDLTMEEWEQVLSNIDWTTEEQHQITTCIAEVVCICFHTYTLTS